jgi:hypothetical protein
MSSSSLADNIGELRVQDIEKKVNLLSFGGTHLYSDVAWSCGRRTHNEWPYRLRVRTRNDTPGKTPKKYEKSSANLNRASALVDDVE